MGAYSDRVMADGASNYWRLGETSGLVAVDVIGGKNATIVGGVTLNQPSPLADGTKAMTFNGSTGSLETVAPVTLPVTVTIEGWIKTGTGGFQTVFSNRAGGADVGTLNLGLDAGGAIAVADHLVNNIGVRSLIDVAWHHLVAVLNGTHLWMYVDGVLDKTVAFAHGTSTQSGRMSYDNRFGNSYVTGSLDDIAIYPRALSAAEIAKHYELRTVPLARDLTTLINPYLATLTGDMTARWKQMEKNAGF